jgi:methyl-accepting chemotaxis protein
MKVTISAKLTILLLLLSIIIVASTSFFILRATTGILEEQITHDLSADAVQAMAGIDRFMGERQTDLILLTHENHPWMANEHVALEEKITFLRHFVQSKGIYNFISIYDRDGYKISDTRGLGIGTNAYDEPFFAEAIQGEIYSDPRPVSTDELSIPVFHFSGPLYEGDEIIGVLVFVFPITKLHELLRDISYEQGYEIEVDLLSKDGLILYSSYDPSTVLRDRKSGTEIFTLISQSEQSVQTLIGLHEGHIKEIEHQGLYIAVSQQGSLNYVGNDWILLLAVDTDEAFSTTDLLIKNVLISSLVLLLFVIVLSYLISRYISKPVILLKNAAQDISRGKMDTNIAIDTGDEIGDLARSFDNMRMSLKMVIEEYEKMRKPDTSTDKELEMASREEKISEQEVEAQPLVEKKQKVQGKKVSKKRKVKRKVRKGKKKGKVKEGKATTIKEEHDE